jgi:hypothetical protein
MAGFTFNTPKRLDRLAAEQADGLHRRRQQARARRGDLTPEQHAERDRATARALFDLQARIGAIRFGD